jgi:hypothetical protein
MLLARQGRRRRAGRARLTRATSASRCSRAPPRRPRRRSGCLPGCREEGRVRDARGETGPPAQSRALATYQSSLSVALLLSASESDAAPTFPIWLLPTLQRGEEGQGCSWRDRAAGTEQGARDLL